MNQHGKPAPGTSIKVLDDYYTFSSPLNLCSSLKHRARQTPGRPPVGEVRGRRHYPDVLTREAGVTKAVSTRLPQRAAPHRPLGGRGTGGPPVNMTAHPLTGCGIDFVVLLSEVITRNWPSSPICMAFEYSARPFTWPLNSQSILMESLG